MFLLSVERLNIFEISLKHKLLKLFRLKYASIMYFYFC